MPRQKITTFLWFDNQAEEAAQLYTSIFADSRIVEVTRYGEGGPGPKGTAMTVVYELAGQQFIALNGGPQFKFTEAISLQISCEDQLEVDDLWSKLSAGGEEGPCGWLKDKYGLSWQVHPVSLLKVLGGKDKAKTARVMKALWTMSKPIVAELEKAAKGK